MPIKKSAVFLLLLATGSVGSLIFISYRNTSAENSQPAAEPVKCSKECNKSKALLPWNILPGNLFQPEV